MTAPTLSHSIVLALQALQLMQRSGVPVTATSLEVWMTHASGALPGLSADIAAKQASESGVSEADVVELFERHCQRPNAAAVSQDHGRLPELLAQTRQCLDDASRRSNDFCDTVRWAAAAMKSDAGSTQSHAVIEALEGTATRYMADLHSDRDTFASLRRQIELVS